MEWKYEHTLIWFYYVILKHYSTLNGDMERNCIRRCHSYQHWVETLSARCQLQWQALATSNTISYYVTFSGANIICKLLGWMEWAQFKLVDESELFVKLSMILCFYRIDSMRLHDWTIDSPGMWQLLQSTRDTQKIPLVLFMSSCASSMMWIFDESKNVRYISIRIGSFFCEYFIAKSPTPNK